MVTVGRVVRPHGNKGQVVVAAETDFGADRFRVGEVVWWSRTGTPEPVAITDSRPHDGRWVIGLEGVRSIDDANALRDVELRVPAETLRPLGPQAYYVHELAGCRVETADGRKVGTVGRVDFGSGTPILVVLGAGREVLVPMAEDICRRIDVSAKVIVIDPPEGLIELNDR
jgi:16S rRNA processing protein RimM